jgi:fibronectin type 3 domain-containing protein
MRKIFASILLAAVLLATRAVSQTAATHSVALNWTASSDAAANPTLAYNVYRLVGACPSGSPTGFTKVASSVTTVSYTDTAVSVGNTYCYYVTSVLNGLESVPSNAVAAVILPAAPSSVTVAVH